MSKQNKEIRKGLRQFYHENQDQVGYPFYSDYSIFAMEKMIETCTNFCKKTSALLLLTQLHRQYSLFQSLLPTIQCLSFPTAPETDNKEHQVVVFKFCWLPKEVLVFQSFVGKPERRNQHVDIFLA